MTSFINAARTVTSKAVFTLGTIAYKRSFSRKVFNLGAKAIAPLGKTLIPDYALGYTRKALEYSYLKQQRDEIKNIVKHPSKGSAAELLKKLKSPDALIRAIASSTLTKLQAKKIIPNFKVPDVTVREDLSLLAKSNKATRLAQIEKEQRRLQQEAIEAEIWETANG